MGSVGRGALGSATDFEFRISRQATFASDGSPVFSPDSVSILLEAENAQFATVDTAPDSEGLSYAFTPPPSPATTNTTLISLTGTSSQVNDAAWIFNPRGASLATTTQVPAGVQERACLAEVQRRLPAPIRRRSPPARPITSAPAFNGQ
jgi:hypothetical protein